MRIRLVSALIYAADEVHIGEDRAPRREEEFNEITGAESRKHWRRHQAVQGPTVANTYLVFEGTVDCPGFELDLRKALRKAFSAVPEMNAEVARAGIDAVANPIRFVWNRKKMWTLMVARVCSDLQPRAIEAIVESVLAEFTTAAESAEQISKFCEEDPAPLQLRTEIGEVVSDYIVRNYLTETSTDVYALSTENRVAKALFDTARAADNTETILVDQAATQYENALLKSPFGATFLSKQIIPKLRTDLNVNVAGDISSGFTSILEASPTATRILQLLDPPPSVMVQSDLVMFSCIAGSCADLINDPEAILNAEYRRELSKLFDTATDRLPKFMAFIQELALIRALTVEQISEVVVASEEELDEQLEEQQGDFSLNLTQSFPISRPEWSFGYLMLAGRRSQTKITITNTAFAPMDVTTTGSGPTKENGPILAFSVGPPAATLPPRASFRAKLVLSAQETVATVLGEPLGNDDTGAFLAWTMKSPRNVEIGKKISTRCTFSMIDSEATVGDVALLRKVDELFKGGKLKVKFNLRGKELTGAESINVGQLVGGLDTELAERLNQLDPAIPYPQYLKTETRARLKECHVGELQAVFDTAMEECASDQMELTTFFLRYTSAKGDDYFEEFLGIQPPTFRFNAPTINGDGVCQAEVEKKWADGVEWRMEATYRESVETLAKEFRDWVADTSKPFPFGFSKNDLMFHYAKTRLIVTFDTVINRRWHRERRVIVRLRQLARHEQYAIERDYWKSEGDEDRVQLLNDLIQKALRGAGNQSSDHVTGVDGDITGDASATVK